MSTISKLITAAVVLGIAAMLLMAYGDMKFDAGWQAATTEQAKVAADLQKDLDDEKAAGLRRLADLDKILIGRMNELNRLKEEKLHSDETYAQFRNIPVHPVTRCRIWPQLCDPSSSSSDRRSP